MSTIVGISTAPGIGGIGIIRMSGKNTFDILEKLFKPKTPQEISEEVYNLIKGELTKTVLYEPSKEYKKQ